MSNNRSIFKHKTEVLVRHIKQLLTNVCFKEYLNKCENMHEIILDEKHYMKIIPIFLKSVFLGKWKYIL